MEERADQLVLLADRLPFARHLRRDSDVGQPGVQLADHGLERHLAPLDHDLVVAPGLIPQGVDRVPHQAELVHGQAVVGLGTGGGSQDERLQLGIEFGVVGPELLGVLDRRLVCLADPIGCQDGAGGVHQVDVAALGDLVVGLEQVPEGCQRRLDFLACGNGLGSKLVLEELRLLGAGRPLAIACLHGIDGFLGSPALGNGILPRADLLDHLPSDALARDLLRGLEHDAHRLGGLLEEPQLDRHEAGPGLVVERRLDGCFLGLRRVQVAVLSQHAGIGLGVHRFAQGRRGKQLTDHGVTGLEPEHLRHLVGVNGILRGEHAELAEAQGLLDQADDGVLPVHRLDLLDRQLHRVLDLDTVNLAALQELDGLVEGALGDLFRNLLADLLPAGLMLALHFLQEPAAGVGQPLHLPQAGLGQVGHSGVTGFLEHGLVGGPLLGRHAALGLAAEHGHHVANGLRLLDLLAAGQHAVENLAHLAGEHRQILAELLAIGGIELVANVDVDLFHPADEALERALQLEAGGLALEQVDLGVVGHRLMHLAHAFGDLAGGLVLSRPGCPLVHRGAAELDHGLQVRLHLRGGRRVRDQPGEDVEVEVAELVHDGGDVAALVQNGGELLRAVAAAGALVERVAGRCGACSNLVHRPRLGQHSPSIVVLALEERGALLDLEVIGSPELRVINHKHHIGLAAVKFGECRFVPSRRRLSLIPRNASNRTESVRGVKIGEDRVEAVELLAAGCDCGLHDGTAIACSLCGEDRDDVAVRLQREPRLAILRQEQTHAGVCFDGVDLDRLSDRAERRAAVSDGFLEPCGIFGVALLEFVECGCGDAVLGEGGLEACARNPVGNGRDALTKLP